MAWGSINLGPSYSVRVHNESADAHAVLFDQKADRSISVDITILPEEWKEKDSKYTVEITNDLVVSTHNGMLFPTNTSDTSFYDAMIRGQTYDGRFELIAHGVKPDSALSMSLVLSE
jgi:hypothetical protein